MNSTELLNRIKERDMDAYLQLTRAYGLKLYSHLREQCGDKETADMAFNQTLEHFYGALTADDSQDAVEAILCAFADHTCLQMRQEKEPEEEKAEKGGGSLGFVLGICILSVGILAALWVILGLLMDMNLIPELDLGYSWFNTYVASWF